MSRTTGRGLRLVAGSPASGRLSTRLSGRRRRRDRRQAVGVNGRSDSGRAACLSTSANSHHLAGGGRIGRDIREAAEGGVGAVLIIRTRAVPSGRREKSTMTSDAFGEAHQHGRSRALPLDSRFGTVPSPGSTVRKPVATCHDLRQQALLGADLVERHLVPSLTCPSVGTYGSEGLDGFPVTGSTGFRDRFRKRELQPFSKRKRYRSGSTSRVGHGHAVDHHDIEEGLRVPDRGDVRMERPFRSAVRTGILT